MALEHACYQRCENEKKYHFQTTDMSSALRLVQSTQNALTTGTRVIFEALVHYSNNFQAYSDSKTTAKIRDIQTRDFCLKSPWRPLF